MTTIDEQLQSLMERRMAVERLIEALERYQRATGARLLPLCPVAERCATARRAGRPRLERVA
ncbi:MAG TPA: hypothetical protein VFQ79_09150 [Bryobacteraceae bacterium]|nr:hypothetical protein [Bryobacteraceae bacterium]